jgi:hypothetical protein
MTTANQLIDKSFIILGIKHALAEQIQTALDVLNDMMRGFINRRWQYSHADLALGDNIQLEARYEEALKYLLCEALLPVFGGAIDTGRTQLILKNAVTAHDTLAANLKMPIGITYPAGFAATTMHSGTPYIGLING